MGYGKQTEHISGGLSDTFQTTGRQSDFRPNHRWVCCNYPYIYIYIHTYTHTHIGETDSWAYGYTTDTNMYMLVYEGSK